MRTDFIDSAVAAASGAALLDEHFPGWERVIDLSTLDIASLESCVLGQIAASEGGESDYFAGLELLGIGGPQETTPLGFDQDTAGDWTDGTNYADLNDAWRYEIDRRLG